MYSSLRSEVRATKDDVHEIKIRQDRADARREAREDEMSKMLEDLKGIATLLKTNLATMQAQIHENRQEIAEHRRNWADLFKEYELKRKKDD